MKGNASLMIGVAALLVAGGVIALKMSGGGEDDAGAAGKQRTGERSGTARGVPGGQAAKRETRPAGRTRSADGRAPLKSTTTLSAAEASKQAKVWIDDILQLTGAGKRAEALNAMKDALNSGDEMAAYAALQAYVNVLDVDFDRASFRDFVKPHLDAADPAVRLAAWMAFVETERRPEDRARVRELARDPAESVRRSASQLMALYEDGDFTGTSGTVVLGMLNVEEKGVRREVLRGMTGAQLSPELEAKVIALSRSEDRSEVRDVVFLSLSTQANKSPATINRLIELTDGRDTVAGRAAWGLREGVPKESRAQVAEAAVGLLEQSSGGLMWSFGVDLMGRYGTEAQRPAIEALASRPDLDERSQMSLQLVLQKLR